MAGNNGSYVLHVVQIKQSTLCVTTATPLTIPPLARWCAFTCRLTQRPVVTQAGCGSAWQRHW